MRRRLLPYAMVAALVVVGSTAALFATIRPTPDTAEANATSAPQASAPRAAPELSRTARLAYWRDKRLWVSDLDGSLRYPIASVDDVRRVSLTRWSTDGASIAYVQNARSLVVVPAQGDGVVVPLPRQLAESGYEIKDLRWSTDSRRIAATVLRPTDGRSDVYVVDLAGSQRAWVRVTSMEDVFVSDWISPDELLGYTAGGAIVVVTATEKAVRLLTGAVGVSPIVGPDGRIHFLAGRVPFSRDPSFPFQTAMRASVWSVAADGSDARQETQWEMNDIRLDGRLPDGRYLVHRGASDALGTVTDQVSLLPSSAGVVERVRVAPDGRTAYGFTPDKIVRMDLTKIGTAPSPTDLGAMTVFLDTSGDADVWFSGQVSVVRGASRPPAAPSARYAFELGGHVWQMENGVATLLVAGPALRRSLAPAPRWSPGDDRLLVVEPAPQGYGTTLMASVVDHSGNATPLARTVGAGRSFAWSPSGAELAIAVDRRGQSSTFSTAGLEIRFFDPSGRATRAPIPATEVAWTAGGLFLLADAAGAQGQAIERVDGDAAPRAIVTRDRLTSDPRAAAASGEATLSGLAASADGSFTAVRLQMNGPLPPRALLVIVGADGAALDFIHQDDVADAAWSPTSSVLGYSTGIRSGDEHAFVIRPDGATVASQNGRFAGWTPDGTWYLIGRAGSLYAYPLAGGAPVRLGPGAAPVSAATLP